MAQYAEDTQNYLRSATDPEDEHWRRLYGIGSEVPVSGIYRCRGCGHEITSNKTDQFPPQNKKQHTCDDEEVLWELIVMTDTMGFDS
ncbi:MAG TPA: protein L [Pseudomonas sp.]|nr:protein L [Pseudomonas sp.]